MSQIRPPAPRPCESCPYRVDVPSGVWAPEEYRKLPGYDLPTEQQPMQVFLCHQNNGKVCGGWAGVHGKQPKERELLSLRMAESMGGMSAETADEICNYRSPVHLFRSGQEACDHGLKELFTPGKEAERLMMKIERLHDGQ